MGAVDAMKHILSNKLALLLVCVPAAWVVELSKVTEDPLMHFILNFGAIIPLAWLISEATEHLEAIVGPTLGVLMNSTFGNMVEIILSVQAIRAGLIKVVQASLLGAMLMNLLFVTGCCFVVTGIRSHSTEFNPNSVSYQLGLLGIATLALLVPSELAVTDEWSTAEDRLLLSKFVAVLLGIMYVMWLVFNMWTHSALFEVSPKANGITKEEVMALSGLAGYASDDDDEESEEDEPRLPGAVAVALLLGCTVLVSFHCDFLVESIDPVTKQLGIKEAFVAIVLLPMVGNFSEEIAAINIALKGKLDLAMGVAIGSATQIAMLVVPIVVLLGHILDQPFDLDFEVLQVRLLLASLLVAAMCLRDPQANWLKGAMLIHAYLIAASAFWFLADEEFHSGGIKKERELVKDADKLEQLLNSTINSTAAVVSKSLGGNLSVPPVSAPALVSALVSTSLGVLTQAPIPSPSPLPTAPPLPSQAPQATPTTPALAAPAPSEISA